MGWRNWFGKKNLPPSGSQALAQTVGGKKEPPLGANQYLAQQVALRTLRQSKLPSNMEADPFRLAVVWSEMVINHYTELSEFAKSYKVPVDNVAAARLLRQLCSFYNVLWWYALPQQIQATGRVTPEDISKYMEKYKELTWITLLSSTMAHPEMQSDEFMYVFKHPTESKDDHDFFTKGTLPTKGEEEDFSKVLGWVNQQKDGSVTELTARLHYRTIQVLDLSHYLALEIQLLWGFQVEMINANLNLILAKLVPVYGDIEDSALPSS